MGSIGAILKHPEDVAALVRMKIAQTHALKQIPTEPDLAFCFTMLQRVSRSFAFLIQQLEPDVRNAVCIFYLVLRGLDTVEDDTSIPLDTKLPILEAFYQHIYDTSWHFSCGVGAYKELMEKFHHVSTTFLRLGRGYQEAIEEITKRMGAGMAKFIRSEIMAIGTLERCYNNIEVFRGVVKIRRGLTAKIMERTNTMADVYGAFFDFSRSLASKVPEDDPNAKETLNCIDEIQRTCKASGLLARRTTFSIDSRRGHQACLAIVVLILAIILAIITFKL